MKALGASPRLAETWPNSASIHGAVKPCGEAKVEGERNYINDFSLWGNPGFVRIGGVSASH
jgi:hypothetical protein